MKNKKSLLSLILALCLCMALAAPAWAADDVDENNVGEYINGMGYLVSSERIDNEDGTYFIENIYVNKPLSYFRSDIAATATYTKENIAKSNAGRIFMKYQVTATFHWDYLDQTVEVWDPVGEVTYLESGKISNEQVTTSGNNTKKASATFSFTRSTTVGYSNNHSVTVHCDYQGVHN